MNQHNANRSPGISMLLNKSHDGLGGVNGSVRYNNTMNISNQS